RTAFKPGNTVLNAPADALRIAGFKVQTRNEAARAPIPPINRLRPDHIQGAGERLAVKPGLDQQPAGGLRRPPLLKEIPAQIGLAAPHIVGAYITFIKEIT